MLKKKGRIIIIIFLLLIEFTSIFLAYKSFNYRDVQVNKKEFYTSDKKESNTVGKKRFSIYVQKSSGGYEEYTETNTWPQGQYYLVPDKADCTDIDGNSVTGVVSGEGNSVTVTSNKTVFCYIYFDLDEVAPTITMSVPNGTTYYTSNTATITISDDIKLLESNYLVYFKWSTSALTCNDLTTENGASAKQLSVGSGVNSASTTITINKNNGAGKLYACIKNAIYDHVINEIPANNLLSANMYLDYENPNLIIQYTGNKFNGYASDLSGITKYAITDTSTVNDSDWISITKTTPYSSPATTLTDGTKYVHVQDGVGYKSTKGITVSSTTLGIVSGHNTKTLKVYWTAEPICESSNTSKVTCAVTGTAGDWTVTYTGKADGTANVLVKTSAGSVGRAIIVTVDGTAPSLVLGFNNYLYGNATDSGSGVAAYAYSDSSTPPTNESDWEEITPTSSFRVPGETITDTLYIHVRDAVGNIRTRGATRTYINLKPNATSTLTFSGGTSCESLNTTYATCSGSASPFTITAKAQGSTHILAKNSEGSVGRIVKVTVDSTAPQLTVTVPNGTTPENYKEATIAISDTGGSGLSGATYTVYFQWSTTALTCDQISYGARNVTIAAGDTYKATIAGRSGVTGNGKMYACVKSAITDQAGNSLAAKTMASANMYLNNNFPNLSVSVPDGTTFSKSKTATITLSDATGLKGGTYTLYYGWSTSSVTCSNLSSAKNVSVTNGSKSVSTTLTINNYSAAGTLYVCFKTAISNTVGNSLPANTLKSADMYLDNAVPNLVINYSGNTMSANASDGLSKIVSYVRTDTSTVPTSGWTNISATESYRVPGITLTSGTKYIHVKDGAGNVRTKGVSVGETTLKKNQTSQISVTWSGNITCESSNSAVASCTLSGSSGNWTATIKGLTDGNTNILIKTNDGSVGRVIKTKVDTIIPVLTFDISGTNTATISCSETNSSDGLSYWTQSLTGTSNVVVSKTCTDAAGNSTTSSHTYIYDSCITGSNTCSYGCQTVWDSCATGENTCVDSTVSAQSESRFICTAPNIYSSNCVGGTPASSLAESVCRQGTYYTGVVTSSGTSRYATCYYCSNGYNYNFSSNTCTRYCASGHNTCQGGYVNVPGTCSDCYTGSNTCQGGFKY